MGQLTQDTRSISISDFSLGKDTLLLTEFSGKESLSTVFKFKIKLISENLELSADKIIGKVGTVTLNAKQKRFFNGYIRTFTYGELRGNNLREYSLSMVPWLWFLKKTNNHRIFQEKNTQEIVSKIFKDLGFADFQFKINAGLKREYCIQHNESDFDFVSRLLAEDGISYYFKHDSGKHMLVLVEQNTAYEVCQQADVEYSKGSNTVSQIHLWKHDYKFQKGLWTLNDYNFKQPSKSLIITSKTNSKFANSTKFEHYEYPALFETGADKELVKKRMVAEEASINTIRAESNCSSFYAGGTFKMAKNTATSEKGSYVITTIEHSAIEAGYFTKPDTATAYSNRFSCVPVDIQLRPKPLPRPVMKGPQSALVVGPASEEIYIDNQARIKVQFIWDREGKKDENSSCYLRVMQTWAGNKWGTFFIPRIGHEVIVSFLDGDPDRPIVTGSVYNGNNAPPYSSKTQSGIKTRSTQKGSPENYNELRFEDKKGNEQIYIHAEKNLDTRVENNETLTVDKDRTKTIKRDENSTIENDRNKTVNNNQTETISKNKTITVGEDHTETIKKNKKVDITLNHTETVGKKFSLKAGDEIELVTGNSSIVMKSDGTIIIKGVDVSVIGSGEINVKATQNIVMKGKKILEN